jgi:hypothetical protein
MFVVAVVTKLIQSSTQMNTAKTPTLEHQIGIRESWGILLFAVIAKITEKDCSKIFLTGYQVREVIE